MSDDDSVLVSGNCGGIAGASVSTYPPDYGEPNCVDELHTLSTFRQFSIMHTSPAVHPFSSYSISVPQPFHGQRGYLTLSNIILFNRRFFAAKGVVHIFDEFALTLPLRGYQADALHWHYRNPNPFVIVNVDSLLLTLITVLINSNASNL